MRLPQVFIIDAIAALVYLIAANPAITGLLVHEWVSLGVLFVFIVHVAQHYDWVAENFKRMWQHPSFATTGNLILDIVTVVAFMAVTVSGIMVSRHILPLFGFVAPGYFFWNPVHAISAKLLLALLIVHVVVHFKWFVALLPKREKFPNKEKETLDARKMDE
jgi:hypothetical protein